MSFLKMKAIQNLSQFRANTFFNKQIILYVNICFREHVEENLFNLVHVK